MVLNVKDRDIANLPLVSVIAVCYNHASYLEETLDSIMAQTYPNIELIIMDDCSKDNSVEVIQSWMERNALKGVFVPHHVNVGICKTLNEALNLASGEFVQLLACDDLINPDKIATQVEILKNQKQIGVLFADCEMIDANSQSLGKIYGFNDVRKTELNTDELLTLLEKSNVIPSPSTIIRKRVFEDVGTYDESLAYEDWDFWLRVAKSDWKISYVYGCNSKYRVLESSMWRSKSLKMLDATVKIFVKHDLLRRNNAIIKYFKYYNSMPATQKVEYFLALIVRGFFRIAIVYIICNFIYSSHLLRRIYCHLYLSNMYKYIIN
jgi:glycosyltransferase involved in cell wall biosynthesis